MRTTIAPNNAPAGPAPWLELVARQVSNLRFGIVQITVHDGRVVQIERTEKVRLNADPPTATDPA